MAIDSPARDFRVIIAGAGISGLALANCLELAGIDFILLEARDIIAPIIGAGVYLASGAGPVLEQLGLKQKWLELVIPYPYWALHWPNGDYYYEPTADLALSEARSGYGRAVVDRSEILKMFYDNLSDSAKAKRVLPSKKILRVEHSINDVTVYCADGSNYTGDLIAGADGVHSSVRSEMWRSAGPVITKDEQQPIEAVYGCLYGIAKPIAGIMRTAIEFMPDQDHCIMWGRGKHDKIFFYIYYKLPKAGKAGEFRFTDTDMEELVARMLDKPIMPGGALHFRDLWENRMTATLVPMEYGQYTTTTWGRFAMLGDSVHKQTVSAGEGGNLCVESAAALTNTLKRVLDDTHGQPSYEDLTGALKSQYMQSRTGRITEYMKAVNTHTAMITKWNTAFKIVNDWIIPSLPSDHIADFFGNIEVGAEMLDFVPPPKGALNNTMPYNKLVGLGQRESLWKRACMALPLLCVFALAVMKLNPFPAWPEVTFINARGYINVDGGIQEIYRSFYGIEKVDELLAVLSIYFSGCTFGFDGPGSWQTYQLLTDFGLLYAIMLIESTRRANRLTLSRSALLWGLLAQRFGIGLVGQLYFFFHYISSQMDNYKALDMRLTDMRYTFTIPVAILAHYIPMFLAFGAPVADLTRYWWGWIWQLFPAWIAMIQTCLIKFVRDTSYSDKVYAPTRDLGAIRTVMRIVIAVSAGTWIYTLTQSPYSLKEMYIPRWEVPVELWANARNFMAWDYICCFGGALIWLVLLFKDLKKFEKVEQSWIQLLAMMCVAGAIAGPGATLGLGWLWREERLADKRMKGAVVEGSWKPPRSALVANGGNGHAKGSNGHVNGAMEQKA